MSGRAHTFLAIGLVVGTVVVAQAGYAIAVQVLQDGEKAAVGLIAAPIFVITYMALWIGAARAGR